MASGLVEVLRRYSNREYLTKSVQDVLDRIAERDQTDVPGVQSTSDALSPQRKRLSATEREAVMEMSRAGVASRVIAKQYGVSGSCIRSMLARDRKRRAVDV